MRTFKREFLGLQSLDFRRDCISLWSQNVSRGPFGSPIDINKSPSN
jgi:hypothetical protein